MALQRVVKSPTFRRCSVAPFLLTYTHGSGASGILTPQAQQQHRSKGDFTTFKLLYQQAI